MYKVLVAHPHQQHSYQLATGLNKAGMLFKYITTVYQKPGSLTELLTFFLRGSNKERALGRKNEKISDTQVIQYCEFYGLFYLLLMRITHNNKLIMDPYNRFVSKRFGKKVARYAIKNKVDAVICFDTECLELFKVLKESAPNIIRIMDASAINRLYLKQVYEDDMREYPEFAERLKRERVELFSKNSNSIMKNLLKEIQLTDFFLSPSEIVNKSFIYSGVKKSQLLKCPYGVDLTLFNPDNGVKLSPKHGKKTIKAIYVGGIKELKGIGHLLKAFNKIDSKTATLTVVGAGNPKDADICDYFKNVIFVGSVVHNKMPELLKQHDVFIFPSLGDSFGLAVLEGLACGLPAIVSVNAGVSEYIIDGVNGFTIPANSTEKIVEYVNWFYNHQDNINEMSKRAIEIANFLTWNRYQNRVVQCMCKVFCQSENKI